MRNRLTVFTILLPITFCLTESVAQPQTRNGLSQKIDRSAGITGGFRFDMLAQARPGRRAGFALMPMSRVVNASSSITPHGAGPEPAGQGRRHSRSSNQMDGIYKQQLVYWQLDYL
jgi:hypothetical protein